MSSFERWSVWISALLTTATGIGLFWTKYLTVSEDPWAVVNHPLEPWFLKAHIVLSPLLIFAVGMISLRHIWRHYREGRIWGRKSGITAALVLLPMIVTGYLIQAVTHLGWLRALVVVHVAAGLIFAAGLALHQIFVGMRASEVARAPDRRPQVRAHQAAKRGSRFGAGSLVTPE